MKFPRLAVVFFRLLPPALGRDHILAAIPVDVADAQAVREFERAGNGVPWRARRTDRMHYPRLRGIASGREPGHLTLILFTLWLPTHDEHALTGTEQVSIERRFITGAVPNFVLLPMSRGAPGVLVPVARLAWKRNDDQVRPAVAINI